MKTHLVEFTVAFEIKLEEQDRVDGQWYYAKSRYGDVNSNTPDDCIRILTERAKRQCGIYE